MTHTEGTVGRQVYRRSAAKEIGVLDAIEELLAAAEDEAKIEQLKRLRALMQAYQQRRAKRL